MFRKIVLIVMLCASLSENGIAATKSHVVGFGKWLTVKWPNPVNPGSFDMKVRPLVVDARVKEFTTGVPHEVTERLFVVRRAFRVNDALPTDGVARWQWQRGAWLLVDRLTGRITQVNLPDFDSYYSSASWYREYAAYCGVSEDGKKLSAVVAQLGRRKPVLKKALGDARGGEEPDSACPAPVWERAPIRATFQQSDGQKLVFSIQTREIGLVSDDEEGDNE